MEAVARRKAHWLLRSGSENTFIGKRRPQEDMVTSAVFGSILLLCPEERRGALAILLGKNCWDTVKGEFGADIDIDLWPHDYRDGTTGPEPDVILGKGSAKVIVEVKWHAPLSDRQLELQIEAVGIQNVTAIFMLGEAGVGEEILGRPCFRRTWRDVSEDLQNWLRCRREGARTPMVRWVTTMQAFLQETDMGRIFNGLPLQEPVGAVCFDFSKPDHAP